ncbi:MAG TPA: tetratricopeptide repeat protein [Bryobacteraceae bacterium]|nr:tetratricopeptide repeat protein [Bryobacteraceae bacterium]
MRSLQLAFLALLASIPTRAADFHKGYKAEQRGDYATALAEYLPLATKGNAYAQNKLGVLYYYGRGVERDYLKAVDWYRKAAEAGLPVAYNNLGHCYQKGLGVPRDYVQAEMWFTLAGPSNDAADNAARTDVVEHITAEQRSQALRMAASWRPPRAKDKEETRVWVRAVSYRAIPHDSTYTRAGSTDTTCYGSGADSGYYSTARLDCQTVTKPPERWTITTQMEIYNAVETDLSLYTVRCLSNPLIRPEDSACTWLIPGETYAVSIKNTTMAVTYRKGGNMGDVVRAKYRILDVRAKQGDTDSHAAGSQLATASPTAPDHGLEYDRPQPAIPNGENHDTSAIDTNGGARFRLPKLGVPFLLQGDDLIEMEVAEGKARTTEGRIVYSVPGSSSQARTQSVRPIIMAQSSTLPQIAGRLELYRMEIRGNERQLIYEVAGKQIAVPIPLTIKQISTTLYEFKVDQDLGPGEYALSPKGSNQVFLFEVYQ